MSLPSTHAVDKWEAGDVAISIIIETTAATIKILIVKSSKAYHSNSQYV